MVSGLGQILLKVLPGLKYGLAKFPASNLPKARKGVDRVCSKVLAGLPVQRVNCDGVSAELIQSPEMAEKTGRSVILYLHGGAYVFGSAVMYREFTTRISRMTTSDVLCPDYRLAPEHPFPCALRDSLSTYRWLLEELDVPASSVVFAGDSAGGNLVAATLLSLHESKLPNPAGAVLLSPWLDLTATRTYKYSGYLCDMFCHGLTSQ